MMSFIITFDIFVFLYSLSNDVTVPNHSNGNDTPVLSDGTTVSTNINLTNSLYGITLDLKFLKRMKMIINI